jgi:hypothetical protein
MNIHPEIERDTDLVIQSIYVVVIYIINCSKIPYYIQIVKTLSRGRVSRGEKALFRFVNVDPQKINCVVVE